MELIIEKWVASAAEGSAIYVPSLTTKKI